MINLNSFQLSDYDIRSMVPRLFIFDYYFLITLWPIDFREKMRLYQIVLNLRPSETIFIESINNFDLCSIGFHLKRTNTDEVIQQYKQLGVLFQSLPQFVKDKQIAGQDIGIYIPEYIQSELQGSNIIREIGKVAAYAITSSKFGNLSYPQEGYEVTHILTDKEEKNTLSVSAERMSSNEIIYEFGEGECSKKRSFEAINTLKSSWTVPCQIHDAPDREACFAEFRLNRDTVATMGRCDYIEKLSICKSVGTYPKAGALALQFYNEDKRMLPIVTLKATGLEAKTEPPPPNNGDAQNVLPIPMVEPFIKPRHFLLSFSRR
jgi:hypothetical protein